MTTALPPTETAAASSSDQITLTETDRSRLYTCIHTGHTTARVRTRAQILLKLGEGWRTSATRGVRPSSGSSPPAKRASIARDSTQWSQLTGTEEYS